MNESIKQEFADFIKAISLKDIAIVSLSSKKTGNPTYDAEFQVTWKQSLADGDPIKNDKGLILFRLKYDAEIAQKEASIFVHASEFVLSFTLVEESVFEKGWSDSKIKDTFLSQQILTTVWPIFRQNLLDSMSRLGMRPITLPWLFKQI